MRRLLMVGLLISIVLSPAFAQSPTPPLPAISTANTPAPVAQDDDVVDLETIVVSGAQPGPGLWKVTKGDHTLWILGTLAPLPKRMEWESAEVERVIANSQEVIESPSVDLDAGVGLFRGLFLLPSLFKARKNPDGKTLQQVLPAAQYARWQVLKARYIGGDRGIEQWRPVFAALELYEKAINKSGMTLKSATESVVKSSARKHEVKVTTPKVTIKIANARAALKEFSNETLNDGDCFRKTLDRIESDLSNMALRANAWAVGDIAVLRDLPAQNQFTACNAAFTSANIARKQGIQDLTQRIERTWVAAAEAALAKNTSTFATLPISQLLQSDGYLAKLRAKGYIVEAP